MANGDMDMRMVRGEKLYLFGPMTTETLCVVPRKWWQFWKPRFVEEYRRWDSKSNT